jgi:hypothetical protein
MARKSQKGSRRLEIPSDHFKSSVFDCRISIRDHPLATGWDPCHCHNMKIAIFFLLLGIAIGYFLPRAASGKEALVDQSERKVRTESGSRSERPVSARPMAEFEDLSDDELEEKVSSLSNEEIRAQIKAVLSEVDPFDGLDDGYDLMEALLERLAIEDFHGTLVWLESSLPTSTYLSLRERVFETYVDHDFYAALTYAESLPNEEVNEELWNSLFAHSFSHGNSAVEKAFMLFGTSGKGSYDGKRVKFPAEFNFNSFANLLVQKTSTHGEGESLPFYPTNLLYEWAARDVEAALAFYNEHFLSSEVFLTYEEFSDLIEGYVESVQEKKGVEWLHKMLSENLSNEVQRNAMMRTVLAGFNGRNITFLDLYDFQKGPGAKSDLTAKFLLSIDKYHSGTRIDLNRRALLQLFPSPEARLDHLVENANSYYVGFVTQFLETLGHTSEDISRFREAVLKKP